MEFPLNCIISSSPSPIPNFNQKKVQKVMELHASRNKAFLALYAEVQLTREEFTEWGRDVFRNYEAARKKYECEKAFPHVYDKVSHLGRK